MLSCAQQTEGDGDDGNEGGPRGATGQRAGVALEVAHFVLVSLLFELEVCVCVFARDGKRAREACERVL